MRHLKAHIERVSQEDASTTDVDLKEPAVGSEPEELKEINTDCLVDLDAPPKAEVNELEECNDIKTSLEHFSGLLDDAKARGGMRPAEAVLMRTSLKHFAKRLGVAQSEVPSMEDFDGDCTRMQANTISQEAIVVIDKALIDKIVELIKKMLAKAKEFIAKLDVQTVKVDQILGNIKARYRKWKTGEVTFKSRFGSVMRSEDLTPQGLRALTEAANFSTNLLYHFQAAVRTSTRLNVNVLLGSAGEEADITKFEKNIREIWGPQHSPFVLALNSGRTEINIGSATHGKLKNDTPNGLTNQYSMEFITDYGDGTTAEAEVTLTKSEFSNMVSTCNTLNEKVKKNTETYKAITQAVVELGQMAHIAKNPMVISRINTVASELSYMHTVELENVVRKVAYLRNALGVFLLLAGSEFDKDGESVNVANNK
jgi:hypothetical protein